MGIFNSLTNNAAGKAGNNSKPQIQRFFGVVEAYHPNEEPKAVTVKLPETGEVRKVHLDHSEKTLASLNLKEGMKRPDIDAFANRGKSKTEIGGTLLIEGALKEEDGTWKARWIQSAVYSPSEGYARTFPEARVGALTTSENGKQYRPLDILDSAAGQHVRTKDELDAAIKQAIASHGSAYIRFADTTAGKSKGVTISGGSTQSPIEERLTRAFSKDAYEKIAEGIASLPSNEIVEVVPAKRLMFGADAAKIAKLDEQFTRPGKEGQQFSRGFTDVMVTVVQREDGSEFVTKAVPLNYKPEFSNVGQLFKTDAPVQNIGVEASEDIGETLSVDELGGLDLEAMMDEAEKRAAARGPGM